MKVVWFNRPYLAQQVAEDAELLVHGVVRQRGEGWELVNPTLEPASEASLAAAIVPVYPSAGEMGPALVRRTLTAITAALDWSAVEEPIPRGLLDGHDLPALADALRGLHEPAMDADVEALNERSTPCHHRLVYGELLRAQLELAERRRRLRVRGKPHRYDRAPTSVASARARLPFELTRGQERTLDEIVADLEAPYPMARLLQGDVGCGKTAVAAIALAVAADSGLQGALMVPTELLAEQQFRALAALIGQRRRITLMTSSVPDLGRRREEVAAGATPLVVGTHALIQESVEFARLGLVVVDEQHRFGVAQRRELQLKGQMPDLLVMTATPIPRSFTLAVYGDLSLSVIDELPPGRRPVATSVVAQDQREKVYKSLGRRLVAGARAYVVLPLIEESSGTQAESIEGLGREIERRFSAHRPVVIHGRTDPAERVERMEDFASGRSSLLIATTLIEVGVDVPEATVMIIESAERFGLSQLHQLRGRVGRGREQAECVALHGALSPEASKRLQTFAGTQDGFELAEADLAIRGPGDLLGTRQSGAPALEVADLVRDRRWIELARADARRLVREDPPAARRLAAKLGPRRSEDFLAGG
jgi:ATP-dependent DNA helicase RecG